ncbi:MAG TPA: aconitate hydratase [Euryarchaeota archaeon]|nr:MAG: aconitate hydratase [Thermoplasmata archaeon]HHD16372.1 aconitate hydratase [Euryarchaeota archaeon]
MGLTLAQKILKEHLIEGTERIGEEIAIRMDHTLTQDATGTMAYLQFEAMGLDRVRTERSVSFIDHNMLQTDFRNADDHRYLQSIAKRFGITLSKAGNGICHQVFLERFAVPGKTLIGSDSHTPTAGGIGQIAIGAGGLDVAVAMAGGAFKLKYPRIMGIRLTGRLPDWVSGKDIILEVLRRIDVKGGRGYILEYFGPGVETLSVPDRATITNMGTETGATTSIFPSDDITRKYMKAMGREHEWKEMKADEDASYDEIMEIDLSTLVPLAAKPHSPGLVSTVEELAGMKVDQVCIGSCTNSSYRDLMVVARTVKGKKLHEDMSATISPGSRTIIKEMVRTGAYADLVEAGFRILESACGPCIGMGFAPNSGAVSVRTFNRNFEGRSGTKDAKVYLVSPETAAATALNGVMTDPRELGDYENPEEPVHYLIDDNLFIYPLPPDEAAKVEILRGPNIKPLPEFNPLPSSVDGEVLIKVGDNITTDHIMPAGAKILPLRSNIPAISEYVFSQVDEGFPGRAKEKNGGFIIGGENYGQGSSREHAALAPKYLGVKAVIVKSFARIHRANLVNFGILPLTFKDPSDYEKLEQGDLLRIDLSDLAKPLELEVRNKGLVIPLSHDLSEREIEVIKQGGTLNYTRNLIS